MPTLAICPEKDFEKFQTYSGFLYCLNISKNITFASNQKTEQISILSDTIMACNSKTKKVTYDLGCQGFSQLGPVDFFRTEKGVLTYLSWKDFTMGPFLCY